VEKLDNFSFLYIEDERHARDESPIDPQLDAAGPSRAYLHHLFKIKDGSAERLATKHNLTFYASLIDELRRAEGPAS
jgi:queuine tRNA-ribosyltransferase